jgi:TDG/mug DNA glycosylase family protein
MTDLVRRTTVRANQVDPKEFVDGFARVERLVEWLTPKACCFVGLSGWRTVVDRQAVAGLQPRGIGGRPVYLMPHTSGLNAHSRLSDLTDHLMAAAEVADQAQFDH